MNSVEEAIELLPRNDAKKYDFEKMDAQLKDHWEKLSQQIAERSNFLGEEKRKQDNIAYNEWRFKIQSPLNNLIYQAVYVNWYIYNHATAFSCCTSKAEKLQAKQDALQAYSIIQKVISDENYTIEQQNIDLFKIHDHNIRNGVLLIVGAVILFAVALTLVIGAPFILAALVPGILLTKSVLLPLFVVAASTIPLAGCSIMGTKGIDKFTQRRSDTIFRDNFSNKLTGFFHNDVKTLLPNTDAPAADPTSESTVQPPQ